MLPPADATDLVPAPTMEREPSLPPSAVVASVVKAVVASTGVTEVGSPDLARHHHQVDSDSRGIRCSYTSHHLEFRCFAASHLQQPAGHHSERHSFISQPRRL